jgi:hypothetical protein
MYANSTNAVFSQFISALEEQTGAKLAIDADNSCDLVFDDLPVSIQYLAAGSQLLLYCVVGTVPESQAARLDLFSRLLDANFLFRKTGGGALAADAGSGLVSFQRLESARGLDSVAFLDIFEGYLQLAAHWREQCLPRDAANNNNAGAAPLDASSAWVKA